MKTIKTLCTLLCVMLMTALSATAQNTDDDKNKAIIEAQDGSHEMNTDDIQLIRFDGGKITVVQPWGETTFDHTLRSLSFQRPNPGTLRLTVNTSIGTEGSGTNRAQGIDTNGNLKSTWAEGDVVYVYADENSTENIGTLTPKIDDWGKSKATLSGNINASAFSDGKKTLYFSTKDRSTLDLSMQDGTVGSLFYFTAQANVTVIGGNASLSGTLTFTRPIAVVKFTLKDKADGTSPVYTKSLTVNDGTNNYVVTPATLSNELYVGIPGISSKTVTLTATDGISSYSYVKTGVTFEDNDYYAINVKMTNTTDYLTVPLTLEAKTAGTIVIDSPKDGMQYTKNGGEKTQVPTSIDVAVGDIVQFYGNGTSITSYNGTKIAGGSADCYIYGNIMSLVDEENYATATSLTGSYTFYYLFNNNGKIYNHASKELKLPATTLSENCYRSMFLGCTNLTTAPALPAKILPGYCYYLMFGNCANLTNAPELPATTLAENCYHGMFLECTGLTTAPELPATTLATSCYSQMFQGCTGLTTVPALPATTLASFCYQYMFLGCTGLTTASELPAMTLASYCYEYMFYGCSNLNSVTCLATDISATNCTNGWLSGVPSSGTFTKAASMSSWSSGANGIPSNWTIVDAVIDLANVTADTTVPNGWTVTGTFKEYYKPYKISIADGAMVTLDGVDINSSGWSSGNYAGLTCLGNATIILKDGTTNTVKGFSTSYPGIYVPSGHTLTIQGTGTLNASSNSSSYAAGIGGGDGIPCGNIIINSGTITATCGSYHSAGIGSGDESSCGDITINGGTVNATGGDSGAGIGSGRKSSCGIITISGGTVTATGGDSGAGIGSGYNEASCGNITISGGTVEATGGEDAAGIGGGEFSPCNAITIENTVTSVTATKGDGAYNSIGKGYKYRNCGTVTIGGTVYYDGSSFQNGGETYLATSPLVYAPAPTVPTGAIDGKFTINGSGDQVYFSQGNLQYQASTSIWRFAENQWDYVGDATNGNVYVGEVKSNNASISSSYTGWIDLFGWGTSGIGGYTPIATCYQPYSTSTTNNQYNPYGSASTNLYDGGDNAGKADWGYNTISNGGNQSHQWRTLTTEEWQYLFNNHTKGWSTVNGVNGYVIRPDGVSTAVASSYTTSDWATQEAAGSVFLPAAGYRSGTSVSGVSSYVCYWSSSYSSNGYYHAYYVRIFSGSVSPQYSSERSNGRSVRLVHPVE